MSLTFDAVSWSLPDQETVQTQRTDGPRGLSALGATGDPELMALIGAGDRNAFAVFCRRHTARSLAVAYHLLRDSADAEEVVQDAFLRVWQSAGRWRNTEARVTTWLFRVVVNRALDQMRRATRQSVSIEHAAEIATVDPDPETVLAGREFERVIARAIAALPPRQRVAIGLVVHHGLGCAEAARAMRVTVGTMESLLARGRRQIRLAVTAADEGAPVPSRRGREKIPQEIAFSSV